MNNNSFSVCSIVVMYNGNKWIDNCLSGLLDSDGIDHSIIVIDNGSTDKSVDIIKERYPQVDLIEAGENLGFGKANNIGIKKAIDEDYDYAFLLNQDAWIEKDTISELIKIHKENLDYGILAPLRQFKSEVLEKDVVLNICNQGAEKMFTDLYHSKLESIYSLDFIGAAGWLIPQSCFRKVGGFDDELFFHYGEDNDYCERVRLSGFKIGVCPKLLMVHDTGERTPDKKMRLRKQYASTVFVLRYKGVKTAKRFLLLFKLYFLMLLHKRIVLNDNNVWIPIKRKTNYYL